MAYPEENYDLRRDILRIFYHWHSNPLTEKEIKDLLARGGRVVSSRTINYNLTAMSKPGIDRRLIKTNPPSNRGRPRNAYSLDVDRIYRLFKETEDLVDAMDFSRIQVESGVTVVERHIVTNGNELRSLWDASPKSGHVEFAYRQADEEDFEKTWRLANHVRNLQRYYATDSPAFKEYERKKIDGEMRKQAGIIGMRVP